MYSGTAGTEGCQEKCALFPIFESSSLNCGVCEDPPTAAPAPTLPPGEEFNIDLDLRAVPLTQRSFFRQARDVWTDILTRGLTDVDSSGIPSNLLPEEPCLLPTIIDDLYICVKYEKIDKEGKILGSGSPVFARSKSGPDPGLPITGKFRLDEDDVEDLIDEGLLIDVIVHEMSHVLGIGTLWKGFDLRDDSNIVCLYTGAKASAEYEALSGCQGGIPIDDCSHWSKECFGRELLTDTISSDPRLSRISIAALEDLGYAVDYSTADTYTRFDIDSDCRCNRRLSEDGDDGSFDEIAHTSQRRSLSEEGYEKAFNYGMMLLEEAAAAIDLTGRSEMPEGIDYVADQWVNVFYREEGAIYGVLVQQTDRRQKP